MKPVDLALPRWRRSFFGRLPALPLLAAAALSAAELPGPAREALAGFATDAPPGWAYTLTTRRGGESSIERYDPARPPGQQWQLLKHNGADPSPGEIDRYDRYRVTLNATAPRATFRRGDIDSAFARFLGTTDGLDEYACLFRADVDDPLLNHLELRFWVARQTASIPRYQLHLKEPFSPIIGMKIEQLDVEVILSPPAADRPALPRNSHSVFHGRFLLVKSVDEETSVSYSDYERRTPPPPPSGSTP
ncbi:MAG: hypothetical protein ACHQ5A_03450 [Opitutales bacterium]